MQCIEQIYTENTPHKTHLGAGRWQHSKSSSIIGCPYRSLQLTVLPDSSSQTGVASSYHLYCSFSFICRLLSIIMPPRLPATSAGPQEVRKYISQTLVSKHHTAPEFADNVAGQWQLGRGSDLQKRTSKHFEKIFGVDIGLYLFECVREDKDQDFQQSMTGIFVGCKYTALLRNYELIYNC